MIKEAFLHRAPARFTWVIALAVVGSIILTAAPSHARPSTVLVAHIQGTITPVLAEYLREGIRHAEEEGHEAFLVELDTPGGLDAAMRDIVQAFLGARVPVIVYVSPEGARAASAGAIITLAAHVAAMAPGTAIGAATPVDLQGGETTRKVVNDAASYARSIAEQRERDVEFAVDAVRDGRSATAREAVEIGAVDLLASSRAELLAAVHGEVVELDGRSVALETQGDVVFHDLGAFRSLLQWLADPNLAFLFMSLGTLALLYEFANPGVGVGGIAGVILLVLALASLAVLPVNAVGAILLVLAVGLYVAEMFAPGIGLFAVGGTTALVLAGAFLFRGGVDVHPAVLLPSALLLGGGTVLAGRLVARSRRLTSAAGSGAVIGQQGIVRTSEGASGQVVVQGVWWNARSKGERLKEGDAVRVVGIDGLDLLVEPQEESP
ncbi:MAG: nodulation protein NfeD [Actinomycetota bacterium]|nr:nodulation protein NfeD [Actinomycetota bacterium]